MKFKYVIYGLALLPLSAFSQFDDSAVVIQNKPLQSAKYTVEKFLSNESDLNKLIKHSNRTVDVPTHIIRTEGYISGSVTCEEVLEFINEKIIHPFNQEDFTYNTYLGCGYNPNTDYATNFTINTYFDPLTDSAVDFLNKYLAEVNGMDIFGTPLNIEEVKELVVANNIMVGTMKKPNRPPFAVSRQDRSNFAFKSNYEMVKTLVTDIYENFYSDESAKIFPFLDRWVFNGAGVSYFSALLDANYVEFQPERIFVMADGDIFVSNLRYYYGHLCNRHEHHHCLKRGLQN